MTSPTRRPGKITPYGVYDIAANRGFVSVGTSHDTAAFAVSALRLWWQQEGSARYPGARRLLVVCDAGGSNGYRCRLWKDQLAVLAAETGLEITVCHFPPGTSKWNKIEHRLFCHITRTWRARPLMTKEDAVAGIAATTTYQGLKGTAVLDQGDYPGGVKVSDQRMKHLEARVIARHGTHGEWNYTLRPAPAGPDRSRRQRRGPARIWKDWPRWPGSATWAPCWPPSRCPGPPPASSGCTWTAAAAAARPAAACPPGSRSRPSSPPPPATSGCACPTGCSASSSAPTNPPSASPPAASSRSWKNTASHTAPASASPPSTNYANTPQQPGSPSSPPPQHNPQQTTQNAAAPEHDTPEVKNRQFP